MQNVPIGDEGMDRLEKLDGLRELDLSGTRISDAGLEHIKDFKQLENLSVCKTRITDRGLLSLTNSPTIHCLRAIWLNGTPVTEHGVEIASERGPSLRHYDGLGKHQRRYRWRFPITGSSQQATALGVPGRVLIL